MAVMLVKCLLLTVKLYTIIFLIMYKHCDGVQFFYYTVCHVSKKLYE